MADRYWVGGTASWDGTAGTKWALTSGGLGGQAVPTSADDVFFSNLSTGTCTITTGNTGAKSINCTGFTGTIAGSAAITVSGSITLVAGMTYTASGTITINATATLTTASKTFGALTINGSGITVTLGDALSMASASITITAGTFDTAGYNITAGNLLSNNTNTRTISLNASTVTLSTSVNLTTTTNLTFNAGTSQINLSQATSNLLSSGVTFYNVSFTNTALTLPIITGANTFNNLTFAARAASGIGTVTLGANQTINGTLTVQSGATDPTRRLLIASNTIGTARTITSAANTIFGADFQDITAAGAASWTDSSRTNYWGDCKGNTGITFNAGRTVYWNLAGAQNWSATGWTDTSTGTPNAQYFPLAQDTATFTDAGSVTGTITVNAAWHIGTMDMSGRTSAMTLSTGSIEPFIYGNWTNGSGTTLSGDQAIYFSGRTTQTITSASKTFSQQITINSPSGTVVLADALTLSSARLLFLLRGTFNANNQNVSTGLFNSNNSNTRTLTMGSGLWTITGTGTVWTTQTTTNLTFNKDTADILLSDTTTTARTLQCGGLTYNKLTIGGATGISTLNISGAANTFSELASTKTVAHTIAFDSNQTINTWSVTGSAGNVVTVNSNSAGTSRTLTITNRTSGIDYLDVRDITASLAPVTFYAGANTLLRSNVRGVAAVAPTANQFIYVLNSGTSFTVPANWNNSNNAIHLFAGGGGGGGGINAVSTNCAGGGGGGGGYTKAINVTLSGVISYAIGAAGTAGGGVGGTGGGTTFNSGAYTTTGGGGGSATIPTLLTPTSIGGVAGTGSTYNGGVGGLGSTSTTLMYNGSGGGGGAGGPLGVGGTGGNGFATATSTQQAGGGGGGNGGGSAGGNASASTGGTGGNNNAGVGGGASNTSGFNGGGSGGAITSNANLLVSGSGVDISNAGMGGGAGSAGWGSGTVNGRAGLFGGGGTGGGNSLSTPVAGGAGGQGGIVIVYATGSTPVANSNFFLMFG
jgi:hypothetical protein